MKLTEGKRKKIFRSETNSNRTEAFHLRFDQNFDYFSAKWDWKREFLKMERQVSVEPDRPVKEDYLCRWTTSFAKFPPGPECSIYVSTEISGNFSIMESTLVFFCFVFSFVCIFCFARVFQRLTSVACIFLEF